jgi:stearoyl-CoA 9-desaturase NADPH oxidoreductase
MLTTGHAGLTAALLRARSSANAMLRTRVVSAMCTPHDVDDYLVLLDSLWSVRAVRARIVRIEREADHATSLWLRPNENWRGFRAGQYVGLSVDVNGVRHTRCFSISSAPEDGLPLRVTIKALPGGRLGSWAAQSARRGDVVSLTQALGDFVLPAPAPPKLLFISAGSGITPIASIVRHLLAAGYDGELVSLHYARAECMLGAELTALACRAPRFRFVPVLTRRHTHAWPFLLGHFCVEHLEAIAPWWEGSEFFVCGPASLESAVTQLVEQRGLGPRLHTERFVSPVQRPASATQLRCRLTFVKSGHAVVGNPRASLLEQAESAGLRPAHGCRMGVCHSCKCRKLSGVVRNEITGLLSGEADEEIQLCVSTPQSDVTLEL